MSIYNFKYTHFDYQDYVKFQNHSIIYVVLYIAITKKGGDFLKELFVKNVVNETTDFLDNNQRLKLKEILTEICIYYKIEKLEQSQKEEMQRNNEDILNRFISSKEIEGCSAKTLNYYKDNISKMFEKINLPICEITTETIVRSRIFWCC